AHVFNITIGYDLKGFSARLSYLFQTDKLTGIGYDGVIPTTRLSSYTSDYGRWDLTLQQKLFQNIQLFANFNNLNNRYDQSCIGADLTHPSYIEYYGFTMDLGIRVNL
ncbi:MAG TPA: TonB-dependent receptor, partial [Candidatus Marinimicrobia bacterium]|nr:TonB-dependent receptor [Candidatus Neomarinimicrobiota bacterium]